MNDFSAALNNFQVVQRKAAEKEKESVARARAGSRVMVNIRKSLYTRDVEPLQPRASFVILHWLAIHLFASIMDRCAGVDWCFFTDVHRGMEAMWTNSWSHLKSRFISCWTFSLFFIQLFVLDAVAVSLNKFPLLSMIVRTHFQHLVSEEVLFCQCYTSPVL